MLQDLEPQHIVDAMLCTVRESSSAEHRFCFEIISPNRRAYTLQAESEKDMQDWIQVFQNCTEMLLSKQQQPSNASMKRMSTSTLQRHQDDSAELLNEIRVLNPFCVDCGARGSFLLLFVLRITISIIIVLVTVSIHSYISVIVLIYRP